MTPMQFQYVVGLCCLRRNPEAVDITVGDMVLDEASGTKRDVDVTVTVTDNESTRLVFMGYEVKREGAPLDVAAVEQLCVKLRDMPALTHAAIVSASGYTGPATAKAKAHGVELYQLEPWRDKVSTHFPHSPLLGKPEDSFRFGKTLLFWARRQFFFVVPSGPQTFRVSDNTVILNSAGSSHAQFATVDAYQNELMMRSTTVLYDQEPARTIRDTFPETVVTEPAPRAFGPAWPHTHTLDVSNDGVYLSLDGKLCQVRHVTINGHLQWQSETLVPDYHVLKRTSDGQVFAAAAIAAGIEEDELFGLVFSPMSPDVGVHRIRLAEKHRNAIRMLKLKEPPEA